MKDMKGNSSVKGVYSYAKNPMKKPRQVAPMCGPGANGDQAKANKLLKKAYSEKDSQRGMSGI